MDAFVIIYNIKNDLFTHKEQQIKQKEKLIKGNSSQFWSDFLYLIAFFMTESNSLWRGRKYERHVDTQARAQFARLTDYWWMQG